MTANIPISAASDSTTEVFYEGALGMYSDPLMRAWKSLDDTVLSRLMNGTHFNQHAVAGSQQHHHDTANPYDQYHSIWLQLVAVLQRLIYNMYCQGPYTYLPSC